ncbi:MAG TPA: cysteine desulfurase family protein [Candidatus Didemnitutus sp.]|nr:cysteine desulfurase family protein [Candidatus Didemnitutus sp.]
MIYLDNSATTRIDEEVLDAMLPWLRDGYGNASSIYRLGRAARVAVEDARMEIAALIGAHPAEITFTSGGTESNNTILKSCCGPSHLATHVHVGSTEHHAVLHPAEHLGASGIGYRLIEVDQTGRILLEGLASSNTPATLVSVMHANNETGVVQDVRALRNAIPDALLHSDAVQSFGKIPVNVGSMGVDFLSLSAHKIHGPKGVGAMFIRKGIDFKSHQQGGGQERNRRAGTEPVALIVGFAVAARRATEAMEQRTSHMTSLITEARRAVGESIPNIRINTPEQGTLPNILNISFRDAATLDGEAILQTMDMEGIAVSNGSACVSGSLQPSHVLLAMGLPPSEAKAAVRISVSKDTTLEEIGTAVTLLSKIIRGLRV